MIVDAKADFIAIGRLAYTLRVQVRDIEAAMQRASVTPAMRVNNVVYVDAEQVQLLSPT